MLKFEEAEMPFGSATAAFLPRIRSGNTKLMVWLKNLSDGPFMAVAIILGTVLWTFGLAKLILS